MTGLPSAIAKKYGIGKKAWAVYRAGKSPEAHSSHRSKRGVRMAKKRYSKRRGGGFGMGRLFSMKNLLLVGGAAILGPRLVPQIPSNLLTAGAGFVGAGPVGAVAGYFAGPFISSIFGDVAGNGGDRQVGL